MKSCILSALHGMTGQHRCKWTLRAKFNHSCTKTLPPKGITEDEVQRHLPERDIAEFYSSCCFDSYHQDKVEYRQADDDHCSGISMLTDTWHTDPASPGTSACVWLLPVWEWPPSGTVGQRSDSESRIFIQGDGS